MYVIFGRKKKQADRAESAASPESALSADSALSPQTPDSASEVEDLEAVDLVEEEDAEADDSQDELEDADEDEADEVEDDEPVLDASLREDGPFDIDEVDLAADDIERLDFGCVVLTPFDGMQLQLQLDQASGAVQSALIVHEESALEIALFGAPAATSMVDEIVAEVVKATEEAGGETIIGEGPFGVDLRRIMPVTSEEGEQGYHISRTWYAQGPRWVLRGTLVGAAALEEGFDHADGELLLEVFRNVVVRRGNTPKVPGDLIAMTMPEAMAADLGAVAGLSEDEEAELVEELEDDTDSPSSARG